MTAVPVRDSRTPLGRRTPLDIVEGYYVAKITEFFYSQGLFERLRAGATAEDLCEEFGFDRAAISGLLEFICQRTSLLQRGQVTRRRAGEAAASDCQPTILYTFDARHAAFPEFGYHLGKFLGAYGPVLTNLSHCAVNPGRGPEFVDQAAFGRALQQLDVPPNPIVRQIVQKLGVKSLLELGCGTGQGLVALAEMDEQIKAVGIDQDPETCALATERMLERGLADRVQVICGDATKVAELSRTNRLPDVESVYTRGLLNALFWPSDERAVDCLSQLGALYPGRLLMVEDYYGRLGYMDEAMQGALQAVLQDVVQVLTGQGIPPPTQEAWAATYAKAGCILFHAFEGHTNELPWFIHLVRLAGPDASAGETSAS
jgi:SAM-dependent methyltransferase